jgi:hypothetical protein
MNNNEKDNTFKHLFVPYEIAMQLKEKGFNEPCLGFYSDNIDTDVFIERIKRQPCADHATDCSAPTHEQAIDWLRENHSLSVSVLPYKNSEDKIELCWYYTVTIVGIYDIFCNAESLGASQENYESYNEALNEAFEQALKLI